MGNRQKAIGKSLPLRFAEERNIFTRVKLIKFLSVSKRTRPKVRVTNPPTLFTTNVLPKNEYINFPQRAQRFLNHEG
jgi:hypothetical protein